VQEGGDGGAQGGGVGQCVGTVDELVYRAGHWQCGDGRVLDGRAQRGGERHAEPPGQLFLAEPEAAAQQAQLGRGWAGCAWRLAVHGGSLDPHRSPGALVPAQSWEIRRPAVTKLVDGRAIAAGLAGQTAAAAASLRAAGTVPTLAVLLPTDDPGAAWYVRSIERAATRAGISCQVHRLAPAAGPTEITGRLAGLSADPAVHGIICQTPLPPGSTLAEVGLGIDVAKDVDGANPASLGQLAAGLPGAFPPATAAAVLEILREEGVALRGRRAVVVGRSTVVGKPAALLLLAEDATVTICHSRTRDLAAVCREAEVLVVAAGRAGLIGPDHVAPGAVVIDVGTNPVPGGGLAGDVAAAAVTGIAALLTPVPGGVGPVTTARLIQHTVNAAAQAAR
jgi:methylenetetrahydrofolate dehydrogenase (NADP+)/methenyltetrahydrofolate cyclohydrolase